jgi:pyruvate dehydrogenase kinase 2/3/4
MDRLWTYTFTTAGNTKDKLNQLNSHGGTRQIMAGFAHGLPLSRIHARAFGGDLHVMSMQGHGTDVYLHICKLGNREVPVP